MSDIVELFNLARLGGGPGGGGPLAVPTGFRAALGLPVLNTASITDSDGNTNTLANTCTLFDYPGPTSNVLRIIFGKRKTLNPTALVYPTLPVTDDGSTGSGFLKLISFPKGIVKIHGARANLPVALNPAAASWTITTPVMALGSAAAATDAALTSTEQDILRAQTLKALTYSSNVPAVGSAVSGAKTALTPAIFTGNSPDSLAAVLDNSGGASGITLATGTVAVVAGTIASFTTGATVLAAHQNAIATLAAQVEAIRARIEGINTTRFDGTTTALSVYLNFGVNSDPGAADTIQLGYIASGSEFVRPAGYIDIMYSYEIGTTGGVIYDVGAPLHGQGGG